MLICVDDIVIIENVEIAMQDLINTLSTEFAIKDLGNLHYFLGLEVQYFFKAITFFQGKYTKELLKHAKLLDS